MKFLTQLSTATQQRFLALGASSQFDAGEFLMLRGDQNTDIFLIESGVLEVVDPRHRPEMVIDRLEAGDVVGDMGFIDNEVRSMDVRVVETTICRVWKREVVQHALDTQPDLAVAFYRALVETLVSRVRQFHDHAPQIWSRRRVAQPKEEQLQQEIQSLLEAPRRVWLAGEQTLRLIPTDSDAGEKMRVASDSLLRKASHWLETLGESGVRERAGELLSQELHPYLSRAHLAAYALDAAARQRTDPRLMAHLFSEPNGEDALGLEIDRVLMALPTSEAIRRRTKMAAQTVLARLPEHPVHVMLVNLGSGWLLSRLGISLARRGAILTCIDGDREVLGGVDRGMLSHPPSVQIKFIHTDLVALCRGEDATAHPQQNFIVINALVDHLPDRFVAAVSSWCARNLAPGGRVVFTGLSHSWDSPVFDHLISWPMIRRSARNLRALVESSGLRGEVVLGSDGDREAAVVVTGTRPSDAKKSSG